MHRCIHEKEIDILFHLAWEGSAGPLRADADVQMNNVKNTCDLVTACSRMHVKRIIFASSIMEYEISALMDTEMVPIISTISRKQCEYLNEYGAVLMWDYEDVDIDYLIEHKHEYKEKARITKEALIKSEQDERLNNFMKQM